MRRKRILAALASLVATASAATPPPAVSVSDYDSGDVYWVRGGVKQPYHGMREAWVFNRAMVWLDEKAGLDGAVVCYSSQSPLLLTGRRQVSRWYAGRANELSNADDEFTRFVKKDPKRQVDHVSLPPFQFHLEQHPIAELQVRQATHPWQFLIVVKGRSGPPLFASPWREGPGRLAVDARALYRRKGYRHHFAELHFCVATWTKDPKERAAVVFRLRLNGRPAIVPSLPAIRTAERAKRQGVPIYAVVLDEKAQRLGKGTVEVTASIGKTAVRLSENGSGVWKGIVRGLPVGEHKATLSAGWKRAGRAPAVSTLDIHITDGQFVGYDPKLRLLTKRGKPIGPITGSYRGQVMFKGIGAPGESPLHGRKEWEAAHATPGKPDYGFHWWESLTERELDADYAYLARCGWSVVHLCQGWLWWERLDCGGRIAPHGAEQLACVLAAARRHGLHVHFALSHYPLGQKSAPYAQYLEAGYRRGDYANPSSKFYQMFISYLRHFATLFRDETALSGLTAAGEGDPSCGKTFVNAVHDFVQTRDRNHLFLCEPHHRMSRDPNYYRKAGWRPLLGGMRTYFIDRQPAEAIAVQFKLAALGHVFMAEGLYWGYMGAASRTARYRERVRETFYTGLAYRSPIMMSWEERVVEDERLVFEQVRRAIDWSEPFQRPRLAIRIGPRSMAGAGRRTLCRYEAALSRIPLEHAYVWENDPVSPGTLHTIEARQPFSEPAFLSDGGKLPDALRSEMPLRLPEGFAANYSWSQDRRTLLAFIRDAASPPRPRDTTEAGHYTYADTTRIIERDTLVDTWQVECVRPGLIQLRIHRQEGNDLVLVGQSEMVRMAKVGPNRFTLKRAIAARKGDIIGFYIPTEATHIAASHGGRMLYVEGAAPAPRTPLSRWRTEHKTAHISAFNAADAARPKPMPPRPASGIALQNFPAARLSFRLFDLATKKVISQGEFEKSHTLPTPSKGRHFFLLVRDRQ